MTEPKKHWSLEEIRDLAISDREFVEVIGKDLKLAGLRKTSTDLFGTWLVRLFKKIDDHYEEINLEDAKEEIVNFLAPKVEVRRLLAEVIEKLSTDQFVDLTERIRKKPRVTVGVQKGSCVWLYIKGRQGKPLPLQLTE